MLQAKSRVAPEKRKAGGRLTIPRLELMAALIASRLYKNVRTCFSPETDYTFWTDSTTVLSWIRRSVEWAPFVGNRVREIRESTATQNWRHVPGKLNPVDLPSRGCNVHFLRNSRWWEGPDWLMQSPENWPHVVEECDEIAINQERKKKIVVSSAATAVVDLHLNYFSKFLKTVRMIAWILRVARNAKNALNKRAGDLEAEELREAECRIWKIVQRECFDGDVEHERVRTLSPFSDQNGLLRLESRVSNRLDEETFRHPIVLPGEHEVVKRMIFESHIKSCHLGTQGLMCQLRERYWILGGRRAIKHAISGCTVCKRYSTKQFQTKSIALPEDRVRDAVPFEITGVDFAGPLFLKGGEKVWICLFTCAVYRAVHLELCTSLSSEVFMQALRRFIARRGRPRKIYSDNGTNFVGVANLLANLNWEEVMKWSSAERITWQFNPPSAPWWGGFWERLVGVTKGLLRKVLGRACLRYEELLTVICDCEGVINNRPITYMSNDPKELTALMPNHFLRCTVGEGTPDCDVSERQAFARRAVYQQRLRDVLSQRFRSEYLGQLRQAQPKNASRSPCVGEIILLGSDNEKRLSWPLGRIIELIIGKDGITRVCKVRTAKGIVSRPVQRLYALECGLETALPSLDSKSAASTKEDITTAEKSVIVREPLSERVTRFGRVVRKPPLFCEQNC